METRYSTEDLIEELTIATYGENISSRKKHVFVAALRGLVRLAKAEQMLELREDAKIATTVSSIKLHSHWEVD
jgi:hypothetical protein